MTSPRIMVIGTGSIGTRHAGNLDALGVVTERLSVRALGLDGVLARVADGPGADGAVIATETQLRLPVVRACAERGLPVYVEKPLAYTPADLVALYDALAPVADRSLAGFMMRYHPLLPLVAEAVAAARVYRFDMEIGHDVTQWRQGWSFAQGYAAREEGGGVLLDLCHELDLAHLLFPQAALGAVLALGHAAFPGVDMATQVSLAGSDVCGTVAMDYLSPVSLRRMRMRGQDAAIEVDLLSPALTVTRPNAQPQVKMVPFERNDMFLDAMRDFLALLAGDAPSRMAPRVDLARPSCEMIAAAWAARRFVGNIEKDLA